MCLSTNVHVSAQSRLWPHDYNMSRHKCVQAQTCLGTSVSGHKRVWAQTCLGTNVSGHKSVWEQMCLGTNVSGHNRVGSSMYGHKRVVSVEVTFYFSSSSICDEDWREVEYELYWKIGNILVNSRAHITRRLAGRLICFKRKLIRKLKTKTAAAIILKISLLKNSTFHFTRNRHSANKLR